MPMIIFHFVIIYCSILPLLRAPASHFAIAIADSHRSAGSSPPVDVILSMKNVLGHCPVRAERWPWPTTQALAGPAA